MSQLLRIAMWLLVASAAVFSLAVLELTTGWLPINAATLHAISQQLLWYAYGVTALALVLAVRRD